jgi:hypothetical protein
LRADYGHHTDSQCRASLAIGLVGLIPIAAIVLILRNSAAEYWRGPSPARRFLRDLRMPGRPQRQAATIASKFAQFQAKASKPDASALATAM